MSERESIRCRPNGWPLMYQSWGSLLFIHWTFPAETLRPYIPSGLEIDLFDGEAYAALTPFTLWNVRPIFFPPLPYFSEFDELNVRTYVLRDGVPGVYFFSLDANRLLPVLGARNFFHLPYKEAEITLERRAEKVDYRMKRLEGTGYFNATWREAERSFNAVPGSLEFFLTERYALFTEYEGEMFRCRIFHEQWPLREAWLDMLETDLFEANGLPKPIGEPITHAGGPVHVEVWPLERA